MNSVNKTLYIPLYGKALVSRRGILLDDPNAEVIWAAEGFPLKGKSKSRWLAYYMAMRAVVFDRWAENTARELPGALILHLGCGMDSRATRVTCPEHMWFDVDFPEVISQRRRHFGEAPRYRMVGADIRDGGWLAELPPADTAIVVMEGVSMYLRPEELDAVIRNLTGRFPHVRLLMDCYSAFAAKASRFKNPINDVGVTQVWGKDSPELAGIPFAAEHDMTPEELIAQLPARDQRLFRKLYAGKFSRSLYRLYEYRT